MIRKWRAIHRRDLPRRHTTDPYHIWISETMLCQTQVSRVIQYYNQWLKVFPTVQDLARASVRDVLTQRSGLGYNSRGVRVLQAAQTLVQHYTDNGLTTFPLCYQELKALPGVGDYVASAILAFADNQDVAVIDTNIRRILIHHFQLDEKIKLADLKQLALEVLPRGYARDRYNALMDYGALELTAKKSGIRPLSQQSKFEGSRRQVRAWIVKQLLHHETITLTNIHHKFPDREDTMEIITTLMGESLIEPTSNPDERRLIRQ